MSPTHVSVVLPTFNRAHSLHHAVESVLSQTHGDLDLVVVDDGSTDETPAVLASIADPRVAVVRLDGNHGASAARNAGIARSQGGLVAFLDSDDVWLPHKLERQIAALERSTGRSGLCICSMNYHATTGASYPIQWRDEELDGEEALDRILSGVGFATPCWLVRRDVLAATGGFDESLPRLQDYELTIRIASRWNITLMSDLLVTGRWTGDSVSASVDRYIEAIEHTIARHRELFAHHRRGHSHMIFRAGKDLALAGRRREAVPWFLRALRIHPANLRALAGALLCVTGLFPLFQRVKYGS